MIPNEKLMNSFKDHFGGTNTFDKIVKIENMGLYYWVYVTDLTYKNSLANMHCGGVRPIIFSNIDSAISAITYNDITYNWENIGKLIMLVENEHLEKALDSL